MIYLCHHTSSCTATNVNNATPTDGQLLSWDNTNGYWKPITASGTGTVTSVTAGTGLTGGTITSAGTSSSHNNKMTLPTFKSFHAISKIDLSFCTSLAFFADILASVECLL